NIINRCQHGFTPGKSCTTQLIQVIDTIGKLLDQGEQIDVVYLGMSKAFDKVNHKKMIDKLRSFGFNGGLLSWFQSYLRHHRQKVTALGSTSTPVTSGVPQGSILGPILFLLYVNDLPDAISLSTIATFADDTKLFQCILCEADSCLLQEDLTNINNWSSSSDLMFNQSKCKVQTISRKRNPIMASYSMGNMQLDHCFQERDLGVWISSDLSWKKQVESQSTKANQILGYVKRTSTYSRSYLIRSTRTWNALPTEITQNHNKSSLATFKNILKEYYYSALSLTFDPDDPRT
ncbi:Hypothetical predicted protein, partial [Paramuricea clavata]